MTAPVTRFDAERAVHLSIGAASPLWPAYFVAASSGMALWWLSRLALPLAAAKPVATSSTPVEMDAVVEVPPVRELLESTAEPAAANESPEPVSAEARVEPASDAPSAPVQTPARTPRKRPTAKA